MDFTILNESAVSNWHSYMVHFRIINKIEIGTRLFKIKKSEIAIHVISLQFFLLAEPFLLIQRYAEFLNSEFV